MSNAILDPVSALRLAKRLFDEALPQFNWGASPLSAEAVRLLNDVPVAVNTALAAVDTHRGETEIPVPRQRGPLCTADAEALRLDLGAGSILILTRDRASRALAALSAAGAEPALLDHAEAHVLWAAVAACLRSFPDEQEPTS